MSQDYRTIQSNFAGGLISPLQEGSVGSAIYQSGLSIADNVIFGPGHGFVKRPGTVFECLVTGAGGDLDPNARIFSYEYNDRTHLVQFYTDPDDGTGLVSGIMINPSSEGVRLTGYPSAITEPDRIDQVVLFGNALYVTGRGFTPCVVPLNISGKVYGGCREIKFVEPVVQTNVPKEGDVRTRTYNLSMSNGKHITAQMFYGGRWFLAVKRDGAPAKIYYSRAYNAEAGSYRLNDFTYSMEVYRSNGDGTYSWQQMELADLAGEFSDSSMGGASVSWMLHHNSLLVGTTVGIYSNVGDQAITSTVDNPLILRKEISTRSSSIGNVCELGSYVFFVDATNRSIRCMSYTQQKMSYTAMTISDPVSEYLHDGIRQMCSVDGETPALFVLTNSNVLLCCQFDEGQMVAWSRVTFDSDDHPVSIFPVNTWGDDSSSSGLGLMMDRNGYPLLEFLPMPSASDVWRFPPLDCHNDTFRLALLNSGRELVQLLETKADDGALMYMARTIPAGSGSPRPVEGYENVYYGVPYPMVAGTLRSELPANGTSQSALRSTSNVTLRLFNSVGGEIGPRPSIDGSVDDKGRSISIHDGRKTLLYRIYGRSAYGEPHRLFSGDKTIQFSTPVMDDDRLVIVSREPFPFCVAAIIVKHSIKEA